MTGENALKACARELLAEALGIPTRSDSDLDLRDVDAVPPDAALRAIEKALTVCEDAGEVVEALKKARSVINALYVTMGVGEKGRLANLAFIDDALAKALPSLKGGSK